MRAAARRLLLAAAAAAAAAAQNAGRTQVLDPCWSAADPARCRYEAMQLYVQRQRLAQQAPPQGRGAFAAAWPYPAPGAVGGQGAGAGAPAGPAAWRVREEEAGQPCATYLSDPECDRRQQVAALKVALEDFSGREEALEAALEALQPGALALFRRGHLASAINAVGAPPAESARAAAAARALAGVRWQPGSAAGAAVAGALAELQAVAAAGGAGGAVSFLGRIATTVQRWIPWSSAGGARTGASV
ncbi:unnamed protein product [Prorocentrum cordatum]|uniref:Uncharacterized protein n=1 Tax=Prorocentrum cordatum TaxID=2364126 RepID=A0ABN9PRP6_9DINO|nr:unnamed protein product [Polarella glacialis]